MRQHRRIPIACCLLTGAALPAIAGEITVGVVPSSAPNFYGSSSWGGYLSNALTGLHDGLTQVGDRTTDPTGYSAITNGTYEPGDLMVTSFASWRGAADPGAQWGSAFANERGNRMHFGLHATGDGTVRFALEDVSFALTSTESVLDFSGDFVGYDYSSTRYGVDWGPDRVRGTADDITYASGNGTTLVDEIVYVGVGNAYWPDGDSSNSLQEQQDSIDDVIAWILGNQVGVSCTYTIDGTDNGSYDGSVDLMVVPLPGSVAMATIGIAGIGATRRRRLA